MYTRYTCENFIIKFPDFFFPMYKRAESVKKKVLCCKTIRSVGAKIELNKFDLFYIFDSARFLPVNVATFFHSAHLRNFPEDFLLLPEENKLSPQIPVSVICSQLERHVKEFSWFLKRASSHGGFFCLFSFFFRNRVKISM